jgi:D-alanine-D-alanine ligase
MPVLTGFEQAMDKLGPVPKRTYDHVAVLKGGLSAEREVSLASGTAVAEALRGQGYQVTEIDVARDIASVLQTLKPDACFNALHGKYGEDGCIQGILETLNIPYTHSGVLASSLAMHKERAKDIMRLAGVPVAEAKLVTRGEALKHHVMEPPYVVKPVTEGSSVGVVIVPPDTERPPNSISAGGGALDEVVMVERYIPGREITCAVIGDFATDVIEIVPLRGLEFYDYESKYAPGGSRHELPAQLLPDVYRSVRLLTLKAHQALGCRGVSRADFRYDDTKSGNHELICLELNTQPGMTGTSLVPELAGYAGWSFGDLARWMVEDASCNR